MNRTEHPAQPGPNRRKPYATPRLISYGHVKDIVQGDTGSMTGDGSGTTKPCWIAEALYGVHDPRTRLLRAWLSEAYTQRRPWWPLIALYIRAGRTIAKLILSGHLPRRPALRLFDFLTVKAFEASAHSIRATAHRR